MDNNSLPSEADPPSDTVANSEQNQIAPQGDLILVVGESRTKLEVDSVILTYASSVFRAMLNGSFREASGLREARARGERFEIALPEDAPNTMRTIARILHFKSLVNPNTHGKEFLHISIAAHKYDLEEALSSFTEAYVFRLMRKFPHFLTCPGCQAGFSRVASTEGVNEQISSEEHGKNLESRMTAMKEMWFVSLAALISLRKDLLKVFSKKLIFGHKGPYCHLIDKKIGYCEVQLHMALEMTASRQIAIEQIYGNIAILRSTVGEKSVHCACGTCLNLEPLKAFLSHASPEGSGFSGSNGFAVSGPVFKCKALHVESPAVVEMYCLFRTNWATLKTAVSSVAPSTCLTLKYIDTLFGTLQTGIPKSSQTLFERLRICLGCYLIRVENKDEESTKHFHLEECSEELG